VDGSDHASRRRHRDPHRPELPRDRHARTLTGRILSSRASVSMHRVRKLKQHRGEQPGPVVRAHRIRHDDRVDPWKLIGAPGLRGDVDFTTCRPGSPGNSASPDRAAPVSIRLVPTRLILDGLWLIAVSAPANRYLDDASRCRHPKWIRGR
jgi:hypothetical protein